MKPKITQAVILCAGLGTRLRPLTDRIPKAMIPLAGKPLLEHHIEHLKAQGISDFFINLHHYPDAIRNHFNDGSQFGVRITYSFEPEILGTAGGLKKFEQLLNDTFILLYGDMYNEIDFRNMAAAFEKKKDAAVMIVVGEDHPWDSDLAEISSDFRIVAFYRKPHKALPVRFKTLLATYILRKRVLKYIPENAYWEFDHQLLPELLAEGEKVYTYEPDEYIKDIGAMERYEEVKTHLEKMRPT